ncbi:MAG: lipoyl(octanoyl) transferase LipB [Armatimonadota bacterium]
MNKFLERSYIRQSDAGNSQFKVIDAGLMRYRDALDLQLSLHADVKAKKIGGALVLLEHYPVMTLGVSTHAENLLVSESILKKNGIEIVKTDRGGDVTYHGPGQLTGYLIIDLRLIKSDVHSFLRLIESIIISTLADFGLEGCNNGLAGVWTCGKKVCSIGIAIRGGVTYHGFAFNVDPNLSHFGFINPCGLQSEQITSLKRLLEPAPDMKTVKERIVAHFTNFLNLKDGLG